MMTKKEFAIAIIENYLKQETIEVIHNQALARRIPNDSDAFKDSNVAVAMEFLGMIDAAAVKAYAATRSGTFFSTIPQSDEDNILYISARDMLSILPES